MKYLCRTCGKQANCFSEEGGFACDFCCGHAGSGSEACHMLPANRCPVSYSHLPHDYCDGTPADERPLGMAAYSHLTGQTMNDGASTIVNGHVVNDT